MKTELPRMEEKEVKKQTELTEWLNSLVIVHKRNGSIRIFLDPKNWIDSYRKNTIKCQHRSRKHSKFADAKIFLNFDASHRFWSIKFDKQSSDLCIFNASFGRYKYKRLPFGIYSAPEVFH